MTKKLTIAVAIVMCVGAAFARPHGGPHGRFGMGHRPPPMMHHVPAHYHHHSVWGRGGSHFWPGFVGGVVGGIVGGAIAPAPVVVASPTVVATPTVVSTPVVAAPVVAAPTYTTQQVWVPGRFIDQVQPNGTVVRVWQPGHYITRQVLVQ
jgi:hypothetical protein